MKSKKSASPFLYFGIITVLLGVIIGFMVFGNHDGGVPEEVYHSVTYPSPYDGFHPECIEEKNITVTKILGPYFEEYVVGGNCTLVDKCTLECTQESPFGGFNGRDGTSTTVRDGGAFVQTYFLCPRVVNFTETVCLKETLVREVGR